VTTPAHLLIAELKDRSSGVYFLLVNARQELEMAFTEKLGRRGSAMVFHGMTFDRVYPILFHGLQRPTIPGMMQTDALLGPGMYTASKSNIALNYAHFGNSVQNKRMRFGK
jgi:hypothetical protein